MAVKIMSGHYLAHDISFRLKKYSEENKITRQEMADKMGVSRDTLQRWISDSATSCPGCGCPVEAHKSILRPSGTTPGYHGTYLASECSSGETNGVGEGLVDGSGVGIPDLPKEKAFACHKKLAKRIRGFLHAITQECFLFLFFPFFPFFCLIRC
jgi:hypothetical protein